MSLITRGFGVVTVVVEYVPILADKPDMTAHEWGKKSMKVEPSLIVVSEDD